MTFREKILDDDLHEPDLDALYRAGQKLREEREQESFAKALPARRPGRDRGGVMDLSTLMTITEPMVCERCRQLLPAGTAVGEVRADIVPQLIPTGNYTAWDITPESLAAPVKVTCALCAEKIAQERSRHKLGRPRS